MRRIIAIIVGWCVGFVASYYLAAYVGCYVLWPESNLCGLPAMIVVAPIGGVFAAIVGWRLTGRPR